MNSNKFLIIVFLVVCVFVTTCKSGCCAVKATGCNEFVKSQLLCEAKGIEGTWDEGTSCVEDPKNKSMNKCASLIRIQIIQQVII